MVDLISIHIAKTGGRSFYQALQHEYEGKLDPRTRKIDFFPDLDFSKPMIHSLSPKVSVLHGHFTYKQIEEIHYRDRSKIICWLREPVDRVISNYYFFINRIKKAGREHNQFHKHHYTLLEYARESQKNKMCHFLEGLDIHDLFFIGILEHYDSDLKRLASLLSWQKPALVSHVNKGKQSDLKYDYATPYETITEDDRNEIAKLNKEDVSLYRNVLQLKGIL